MAVTTQTSSIAANLERVRERVARACEHAGRGLEEITIVAVSKTFSLEAIHAALEMGLRHFGENRVQEFETKQAQARGFVDSIWHFIGHLQSNKAQRAVHLFDRIDSVDSIHLAEKLDSAALAADKRMPVLIEAHLSDESAKTGVAVDELPALVSAVKRLPCLELRGLMTIPPYFEHPEAARPYFQELRELRDDVCRQLSVSMPILSMGMSQDFEVAIEEGATEIRVGTALFGERIRR